MSVRGLREGEYVKDLSYLEQFRVDIYGMRGELNGAFLDALVAEGADRAAFLDWESDLTADDGMTDYGTAVDAIMSTLNDYPTYLWGDALGTAVAVLFQSKQDAEEMEGNENG